MRNTSFIAAVFMHEKERESERFLAEAIKRAANNALLSHCYFLLLFFTSLPMSVEPEIISFMKFIYACIISPPIMTATIRARSFAVMSFAVVGLILQNLYNAIKTTCITNLISRCKIIFLLIYEQTEFGLFKTRKSCIS